MKSAPIKGAISTG